MTKRYYCWPFKYLSGCTQRIMKRSYFRFSFHFHRSLKSWILAQALFLNATGIKSRQKHMICNTSKTSASVLSGFPNTRKLMKARGRRPRAFIVFESLETRVKHEARVFEIASQSAPNCKQKKENKTKEQKKAKIT